MNFHTFIANIDNIFIFDTEYGKGSPVIECETLEQKVRWVEFYLLSKTLKN